MKDLSEIMRESMVTETKGTFVIQYCSSKDDFKEMDTEDIELNYSGNKEDALYKFQSDNKFIKDMEAKLKIAREKDRDIDTICLTGTEDDDFTSVTIV